MAVFSVSVFAHEDTRIELQGTKLVGLPKEYSPAELDLKAHRLRIGNHAMRFAAVLGTFFDEPYDLEVSSSWYHERDLLPPYVLLDIHPKTKDYRFQLLLALDTLELIKASIVLNKTSGATQYLSLALEDSQKKLIQESIETVR